MTVDTHSHASATPSATAPATPAVESTPTPVFSIEVTRFDEDYTPSENTRTTTNFANLARGAERRDNLRSTLEMINNRFNELAVEDNERADRYTLELDIISVSVDIDGRGSDHALPLIEILQTTIVDHRSGRHIAGVAGNNFSSYVRDYDFSVLLPEHKKRQSEVSVPDGFGVLHGNLFKHFLRSDTYHQRFSKSPVICLSVSTSSTFSRTDNQHPILGVEYQQDRTSLTDEYFGKMGLQVRYFMPTNSVAPLAFYFLGDLPNDYTDLELVSVISTMETFQKIYRPEIYNARSAAGARYRADLTNPDYSPNRIVYDRDERSRLGIAQGRFAEASFIEPHRSALEQWSATFSALEQNHQGAQQ